MRRILLMLFATVHLINLNSQSKNTSQQIQPSFSPFKGVVYDMPVKEKKVGQLTRVSIQEYYDESIYDYDTLCEITLNQLYFPEASEDRQRFPGVVKKSCFAMILESKLSIPTEGCYQFELDSDDGSRLWINDVEVINNDGGHQMRSRKDTMLLKVGDYTLRIWYFQGMPDRYGLIFDAQYLGDSALCSNKVEEEQTRHSISVFFEPNAFQLDEEHTEAIKTFLDHSAIQGIQRIEIIGHTDNEGSESYNLALSKKRADAVSNLVKKYFIDSLIDMEVAGKGDSQPSVSNANVEGRSQNRRVEIIIHP